MKFWILFKEGGTGAKLFIKKRMGGEILDQKSFGKKFVLFVPEHYVCFKMVFML